MPLDALCLSGIIHELNTALSGARVDKIYQPGRDEVILALRTQSVGNVRLLLSANPAHSRLHLTTLPLENPEKPPMFCMLLRKHMSGARLLEIVQTPLERVAALRFEALNELGDRGTPSHPGGHQPQNQPPSTGRRGPHPGLHPPHRGRRHRWPGASARDVLPAASKC